MPRTALATALLCLALASRPAADGPEPIELAKGEATSLCARVPCPVVSFQCDDASVVKVEDSQKGPMLRALKPGTTLCGAMTPNYQRRAFRVTVK